MIDDLMGDTIRPLQLTFVDLFRLLIGRTIYRGSVVLSTKTVRIKSAATLAMEQRVVDALSSNPYTDLFSGAPFRLYKK